MLWVGICKSVIFVEQRDWGLSFCSERIVVSLKNKWRKRDLGGILTPTLTPPFAPLLGCLSACDGTKGLIKFVTSYWP